MQRGRHLFTTKQLQQSERSDCPPIRIEHCIGIIEKIISVYAPHICVGCEAEGRVLCFDCTERLPDFRSRCYRCHAAAEYGETCKDCLRYGLTAVNAVTRYSETAKAVVASLKFGRARAAAECMAAPMARICGESLPLRTIIVPAPTATNRVRMRGYDQSALLACNLASRIGALYDPLLCRIGSQKQIGANRAQRQAQLQGAFYTKPQYRSHHDVQGAHIILVDDVVTTGATLEAAAEALRAAGARSVEAVVFAQA